MRIHLVFSPHAPHHKKKKTHTHTHNNGTIFPTNHNEDLKLKMLIYLLSKSNR